MKQILLFITFLSAATFSFAQQLSERNDIYLEAGGNGFFASVNYERQLTKQPGIGIRAGVGFYTEKAFYLTIPVGINYLFKLKRQDSFIDAGFGVTWARVDANLFKQAKNSTATHFVSFVPSIGYRRHAKQNMMWRVSITPVANSETFVPWVGFSVENVFSRKDAILSVHSYTLRHHFLPLITLNHAIPQPDDSFGMVGDIFLVGH